MFFFFFFFFFFFNVKYMVLFMRECTQTYIVTLVFIYSTGPFGLDLFFFFFFLMILVNGLGFSLDNQVGLDLLDLGLVC
jgi:hypothetical protein